MGEGKRRVAMFMHNYSGSACSFCKGDSDKFPKKMRLIDIGDDDEGDNDNSTIS